MTADCFAEDRRSVTGEPVFGCFMGLAFTLQTLRPKRQTNLFEGSLIYLILML